MEIIYEQGGITDLQRLRDFIGSLPTKELKEELDKSDHDFIMELAEKFHQIRENEINKHRISNKKIDRTMTDGICIECRNYLIQELQDSQGLIFWKNYLNVCKKLKSDLEILKSKEFKEVLNILEYYFKLDFNSLMNKYNHK